MPDPIRIGSGSDQKRWPEAGRRILAHRLASGPEPFGPNPPQSAKSRQVWHNMTGPSAEEQSLKEGNW